jgi:DNA-binding XRE family transcriptional regulator
MQNDMRLGHARGLACAKTKKFPCIFLASPPPTPPPRSGKRNGKEIFGFASPSISSLYIINHDGIFHNRLYHVNIYMATQYRVKYQKFVQKLRQARLDANLTQVEAGKKLKKPQAYISKIERGERRVDAVELDELAKVYNKDVAYFIK